MSPDLHQALVVLEELSTPGGDLPIHLSTALQVFLIKFDLHVGESHGDHILLFRWQELGESRVVPSLWFRKTVIHNQYISAVHVRPKAVAKGSC